MELEVRRRTGIALLAKGLGVREVARLVGTSPGSVTRWRQTYERAGKEGLKAKRHPGAKPRLSVQDRQRLAAMLLEGAQAHGYSTDLRTLKRVAQVIEKHFGLHYHHCYVWEILRRMKWSPQKPRRLARERDEARIERWRKVDWPRVKKSP
jgi:transposase